MESPNHLEKTPNMNQIKSLNITPLVDEQNIESPSVPILFDSHEKNFNLMLKAINTKKLDINSLSSNELITVINNWIYD